MQILHNLKLIDMASPKIQEGKMILLEGGRIKEIREEKELAQFQGQEILDLKGNYLIPGLSDAHIHATIPFIVGTDGYKNLNFLHLPNVIAQIRRNLRNCVQSGVTTVRDMGAVPTFMQRFQKEVSQGKTPGPRILCSNSLITCPNGYPEFAPYFTGMRKLVFRGQFAEQVSTPQEARNTVRRMVDLGADWIKTAHSDRSFCMGRGRLPTLSDACYEALVDEAHKLGKKVAMHQTWISGFRKGLQFSVETLEHIPLDEKLNNRDVSTFVDKKIAIIPTLKVFGQYLILDEIQELLAQKGSYYLERVPYKFVSHLLNKYRSGIKEKEYASEYYFDYKLFQRQFHLGLSNVSRLHKAGAIIGFGTDSPCDFSFFGLAYTELEYLVKAGLSNFEALQAATRTNAKILGLQTDLGTIEAGKLADLVLIEGDPLRNVSNVKNVKMVWKEGQIVFNVL